MVESTKDSFCFGGKNGKKAKTKPICDEQTNAFVSAASKIWPSNETRSFKAAFRGTLISSRSTLHAETRRLVRRLLLTFLAAQESASNSDVSVRDFCKNVGQRIDTLNSIAEEVDMAGLMERIFRRTLQAHRAKDRVLKMDHVYGPGGNILDEFTEKSALSAIRISNDAIDDDEDSAGVNITRRLKAWTELPAGSLNSDSPAAGFQAELWQALFAFVTGKKREGRRLRMIKTLEGIKDMDGRESIMPYLYEPETSTDASKTRSAGDAATTSS